MRRLLFCLLLAVTTSAPLVNAQDPNSALSTLGDLSQRGQFPQLIQTANSLLAGDKLTPSDRAFALVYLGNAYQQRGEFTDAAANYEKALAIVNRDGQHASEYAATLSVLATMYAQIGQIDTAKHVLLRSIHLFEDENDHAAAAMIWDDLATIAAGQNSRREAHKYMKRSIAESELATNIAPSVLAALATTDGRIAELDGDPHTAIADYEHALDLWKQTHQAEDQRTAWLYVLLGGAYLQAGDIANARESTTHGLTMLETTSGRETVRYLTGQLVYSKILDASGDHKEASTLRKQAQAAMNTGTDRQRAQSEISIAALR